jgi:hypothetical protein
MGVMSDALKRLEKIEREFAVGDEVEPRVSVVQYANPERSPEEEEEIRSEVDAVRATAKKEGRNYAVVYCRPTRERGEDGRVYDKPERVD